MERFLVIVNISSNTNKFKGEDIKIDKSQPI